MWCQEKTTKKPYFSGFRPFISQYPILNWLLFMYFAIFCNVLLLDNIVLTSTVSPKITENILPEKSLLSCLLLTPTIHLQLKSIAQ